jgi:hypothetical protein
MDPESRMRENRMHGLMGRIRSFVFRVGLFFVPTLFVVEEV